MDVGEIAQLADKISHRLIKNDSSAVFHSNGKDNPQRSNDRETCHNQLDFLKNKTKEIKALDSDLTKKGVENLIEKISQNLIGNSLGAVIHSNNKHNPQRMNDKNIPLNNQLDFLNKTTPVQAKDDLIKEAQKLVKPIKAFVARKSHNSNSLPPNKPGKSFSSGRG